MSRFHFPNSPPVSQICSFLQMRYVNNLMCLCRENERILWFQSWFVINVSDPWLCISKSFVSTKPCRFENCHDTASVLKEQNFIYPTIEIQIIFCISISKDTDAPICCARIQTIVFRLQFRPICICVRHRFCPNFLGNMSSHTMTEQTCLFFP